MLRIKEAQPSAIYETLLSSKYLAFFTVQNNRNKPTRYCLHTHCRERAARREKHRATGQQDLSSLPAPSTDQSSNSRKAGKGNNDLNNKIQSCREDEYD